MKKLISLALAVTLFASMALSVSAESTTTLTATVPAASYTLNIPANQEIPYGTTQADIGNITVTNSEGFAVGKNLEVTVTYDAFTAEGISTKIPYTLSLYAEESKGNDNKYNSASKPLTPDTTIVFEGKSNATVTEIIKLDTTYAQGGGALKIPVTSIRFKASSEDWGKALAGEYTSTITFTAEVVVEE